MTERGILKAQLTATILAGRNRKRLENNPDTQNEVEYAMADAECIIRIIESEEEDKRTS